MAIDPVNSGSNYVSQVQPQPQTHAERAAEKTNDRDRDEAVKAAALQNASKPTVNTQGQAVGNIISVKA